MTQTWLFPSLVFTHEGNLSAIRRLDGKITPVGVAREAGEVAAVDLDTLDVE